jgi:hypothetical protein
MVVSAPLPVGIHLVNVTVNLVAVLAMLCCVAVNSGAIRFQPVTAVFLPIPVCSCGPTKSK